MKWTLKKVNEFISDLRADGVIGDGEAFDVASFIMDDEDGLYDYIRYEMNIQSPVEWLADRI
jgi:hypothetical protein